MKFSSARWLKDALRRNYLLLDNISVHFLSVQHVQLYTSSNVVFTIHLYIIYLAIYKTHSHKLFYLDYLTTTLKDMLAMKIIFIL